MKVWPVAVNMSMRKLKIFKRGGTYAFSLDDHIVGTITNPKLRGAIQINDLYKFPEPNKGRYGLAFIDSGNIEYRSFRYARFNQSGNIKATRFYLRMLLKGHGIKIRLSPLQ